MVQREKWRAIVPVNVGACKRYRLIWDKAPSVRIGDPWVAIPDGMVAHFEECESTGLRGPERTPA
jgi:hypothetical protein